MIITTLILLVAGATVIEDNTKQILEEIIVTTQIRDENLHFSQVSVVSICADRIKKIAINKHQSLTYYVSNASIRAVSDSGGASMVIRGATESRISSALESANLH